VSPLASRERLRSRAIVAIALLASGAALAALSALSGPVAPPAVRILASTRIDINRASAAEVALLPGIGPELAARIVEDRERNGPFATLDDLVRVRGIGPAILAGLADEAFAGPGEE
jgi:competence ComEA-like helix-hairpin-helix protein